MKIYILIVLISIMFIGLYAQEALFEVKNEAGTAIFAVYENGIKILNANGQEVMIANSDSVRFYIDESNPARLSRSAFSVTGVSNRSLNEYFDISTAGITAKDSTGQTIMIANTDSIRFYIDDSTGRTSRSGFLVTGTANRAENDYLLISSDSTRINVRNADNGFSVGSIVQGTNNKFLNLTQENYFIGHQSGYSNTDGLNNLFIGYESGYSNTTGNNNTFIGKQSGYLNTEGFYNLYLGFQSGYTSGNDPEYPYHPSYRNVFLGAYTGYHGVGANANVYIGYSSGRHISSGNGNTFVGNEAGQGGDLYAEPTPSTGNSFFGDSAGQFSRNGNYNSFFGYMTGSQNVTGYRNTFIGSMSGYNFTSGYRNAYLGSWSGQNRNTGNYNTFIGFSSGRGASDYSSGGNENVFIGHESGLLANGNSNIFIGNEAGATLTDVSDLLIIDNTDTTTPLVYGEFDNNLLRVNGTFETTDNADFGGNLLVTGAFSSSVIKTYLSRIGIGVSTPTYKLELPNSIFTSSGKARAYAWATYSDGRLKQNRSKLKYGLAEIMKLKPLEYYHHSSTADNGSLEILEENEKTFGLIAQDVYKILPEVALQPTTKNDLWSMDYDKLIPVLINAVQEQQNMIENLQNEIIELKKNVNN